MGVIGEYLIGVTAAAMLCALVKKLGSGKLTGAVTQAVCGIFMALAVVAPWRKIDLRLPADWIGDFQNYGEVLATDGENHSREVMEGIITDRVRTYIMDKAASLDLALDVEVVLSDDELPVPVSVKLKGAASPYSRETLSDFIRDHLDIAREEQIWIS